MAPMAGSLFSHGSDLTAHPTPPALGTAGLRAGSPFTSSKIGLQERLPTLVRISDFAGIAGIGFVIDTPFAWHDVRPLTHSVGIALAAIAAINCLQILNAYSVSSLAKQHIQFAKASVSWICAFASLLSFSYLADRSQEFLGAWAWIWFSCTWAYLLLVRATVAGRISSWRRQGRLLRNVAILGTSNVALAVAHRLHKKAEEVNVVGVFIDGHSPLDSVDILGNSDAAAELASSGKVDEIIVALPWDPAVPLNRVIAKFSAWQVDIRIEPGLPLIDYPPQDFTPIGDVTTLTVQRRPLTGWGAPIKRAEDLILAPVLLVIASPLLLLIAVLVKLDSPGPVFFRQERYGFNNNRIMVLKFRSMHHERRPDASVPQARRNDPRITRVGAILRRTSLDELPQLFNVLRGDMSLIGPRPHAAAHNQKYANLIDGYLGRHRMKPGITGWAQVNGLRGETETTSQMKQRLEYDLYYIANWSLLLDIKILLVTLPVVLRGTNAY